MLTQTVNFFQRVAAAVFTSEENPGFFSERSRKYGQESIPNLSRNCSQIWRAYFTTCRECREIVTARPQRKSGIVGLCAAFQRASPQQSTRTRNTTFQVAGNCLPGCRNTAFPVAFLFSLFGSCLFREENSSQIWKISFSCFLP